MSLPLAWAFAERSESEARLMRTGKLDWVPTTFVLSMVMLWRLLQPQSYQPGAGAGVGVGVGVGVVHAAPGTVMTNMVRIIARINPPAKLFLWSPISIRLRSDFSFNINSLTIDPIKGFDNYI